MDAKFIGMVSDTPVCLRMLDLVPGAVFSKRNGIAAGLLFTEA
jgi:hypothetical protein